ncbi:transmembrane protein 272-like [Liolophura sinensis]|uniref:transmembrane protein 272-like n=1 Tax=Liolophura sinensis TaxID=3198878 RepID=UPI0031584A80
MSMLTRTGTTIRKHRRRQSGKSRRGSAPTILLPSSAPPVTPVSFNIDVNENALLNLQTSPAKSVSFTLEKGYSPIPSSASREVEVVPEIKPAYGTAGSDLFAGDLPRDRSYSFITTLQDANLEADGACDFVNKGFFILGNTRLFTLFIGLMISFPLAMITAGGKYLEECPKEPKIPIYLLVGGCFGLIKLLFLMWRQARHGYDDNLDEIVMDADTGDVMAIWRMTNISLSLFLSIWFILGNYWVFSIWIPKFKAPLHDPQNWCEKHVFMFAFWQIVVCYGLMGVFLLLCFFFSCCHWILRCLSSSADSFC